MKTLLYSVLVSILSFTYTQAQVNRSVMPTAGPAPEINLKEPQRFQLNNGLTVMVVENHKLPRVSIQLTIDNPPILEGDKAGVSSLAGSMMGKGSTNIGKDDFNEEVDFLGASIRFGSQSAFASSLSKYFPRIIELLADAAINPNFTQEEFDKERGKIITGLQTEEKDVAAIAGRVQRVLAYGKDHPYGEFTTENTVNKVTLADVERFYRNYFVPANAYLVVIGDVSFAEVKELAETHFVAWSKAIPPSFSYSSPRDVQYTQINFVDMPNAVQSEIAVQNLVNLKMSDPDYLAALVANQILGGGGEGRLFLNLREDKGYTYGAYSSIGNDKHAVSRFRATTSVRNMVTDSAVVQLLTEIDRIATTPVTAKELANTKAKYTGRFVMALEKPETIAGYALNIATQGLPSDFYTTYLERINAVTIAEVQDAAKKYFSADNARVVIAGKGSEVLENLEKTSVNQSKIPVRYYDKEGNNTEKPDYNASIPDGVSAQKILENYIAAVGGKAAIAKVNTLLMMAGAEMQGMKLSLEQRKTAKSQFLQDITMMGNSMSKQVLNGDSGYAEAQGQRKDFTSEEILQIKGEAAPFPELVYLSNPKISVTGTETINDKKAYGLKINENKTVYYDTETGLKLQEVNTLEMEGQQLRQTLSYDNYKEVAGILFPFSLQQSMGAQTIAFIVTEIKVNEGVSASDFE